MLGGMSERERMNRLSVLPQAMQMGQIEQQDPLNKAMAFQSLGALPRSIQQAGDTANYQDFLRREQDYPLAIANLAAGVQTPPTYQQGSPSFLQQAGGAAGNFAGQLGSMYLMQKFLQPNINSTKVTPTNKYLETPMG